MTNTTTKSPVQILRDALTDICDPIAAMQRDLPEGYSLNGAMAVAMCDKPQYYKDIAAKALRLTEGEQEAPGEAVADNRRCKPCAATRGGTHCWKCGTETFEPSPLAGDDPRLPPIDRIRELAREVGYAIGVHGSQQRDLDIIAAPWTDGAIGNHALLQHIAAGLTTDNGPAHIISTERKPLGRYAATIQMDGWYKQLDISVCPNSQYESLRHHAPTPTAEAPGADAEAEEDAALIQKLSKLLAGVAVALNGPEPELTRWSHHDLPEKAATLMLELEIFRAQEKASTEVTVKIDRNRIWIVKGVQSFMLAHEADTAEELEWYANMLRGAMAGNPAPKASTEPAANPCTSNSLERQNPQNVDDKAKCAEGERAAFEATFDPFEFRRDYDKYGPSEAAFSVWQARGQQQAGVPDGWQVVPREPTEAMMHAGEDVPTPRPFGAVYRAMIAAAPTAPEDTP